MNSFVAARTLTEYPRGRHRWSLLILTVLASILGAYDFQLAPLLPILLPYLHMSHTAYGAFIAFTVLISGISAFFGGPLADRYGRVLIIDVCLGFVTALLFLNVLITNIATFVILRLLMGIVAGLTAGAGAALIRDMSPARRCRSTTPGSRIFGSWASSRSRCTSRSCCGCAISDLNCGCRS